MDDEPAEGAGARPPGAVAFHGSGETTGLMRAFAAGETRLGPVASWPRSLINYVNMILEMPSPAVLFWGPDKVQLYNDGYAEIMGPRHPRYFGATYRECWPETHGTFGPWMDHVMATGASKEVANDHIALTRHGFTEEAYFTFTFSPVRDDGGAIAGVLQPVTEVTDAVLAERRAEALRALAPESGSAGGIEGAIEALSAHDKDIPFALVYLREGGGDGLRLVAASKDLLGCERGLSRMAAVAQRAFEAGGAGEVVDLGGASVVADVEEPFAIRQLGPWPEPPRAALALPLRRSSADVKRGLVILGLSSRLRFDEGYRAFLEQVTAQLAAAHDRALLLDREREAIREVERQKENLTSVFAQSPAPMCILRGEELTVELANVAICQVWGRPREEVTGRPLLDVLPELRGQVFPTLLDDVFRNGIPYIGKEMSAQIDRRGDGRLEDTLMNFVYTPLRGAGEAVEGVLVLAFDVSDEVQAREQMTQLRDAAEAANRAKDEFLAMLAHELRNPLAALQTSLHVIRKRLPSSPVDRQLEVVERQANHLTRIVDDLVDVSRITRGEIELRREPTDLGRAVSHALEATRQVIESREHEVSVSLPMRPVSVVADPIRLEQIAVNLLTNAAKYTDVGGRIWISVEREGGLATLRVRDDGIGIADDLGPRMFQLFQQGARDLSRAQGGLGVGLTIVRRLVELHGGAVEVISGGVGEGTEAIVRLPLIEETADEQGQGAREAAGARPKGTDGGRVLVVDDNVDAAESLAELMGEMGYESRVAVDGPLALRACDEWRPDLVFLDIGLPGMDGHEVAEELRRRDPARPMLVALTGYGQESDRRRSAAAGFDVHLVKPLQLGAIEAIMAALDARRADSGHPDHAA